MSPHSAETTMHPPLPLDPAREASTLPALLVLTAALVSSVGMQLVFSPVQELAKQELALSDFQISLVQGLATSIPVALFAIPLGRLVDRAHRVRILMAMALVWTLGTLVTAYANSFATLFAARMLAGLGATLSLPVVISLAADLSAVQRRGRAMLIISLGKIVGGAAAFAGGAALAAGFASGAVGSLMGLSPWRAVHLVFGAISVALLLPLLFIREPARREVGAHVNSAFGPALRALWARRALLGPLFLGQVTVVMADAAAAIWAAPVLTRDYGQQPGDFAGWMGGVLLLSGLFGTILGGLSVDWGQKTRLRGGLLIGAVIATLLGIPGALFPIMPSVGGFAVLLGLLLTCGTATGLVAATAIAVQVPNEMRGVCLGAFLVLGAVVGLGLAPTLVTLISDLLGGEAHIRYGLTAVTLTTSVIAAYGFIRAMRAAEPVALSPSGV